MAEACTCGTYAIGRCQGCGTHVCGTHSKVWHDRRLCLKCGEQVQAEMRLEADKASAGAARAYVLHELSKVTDAMCRCEDTVERYLIAVVAGPLTYSTRNPHLRWNPYSEYPLGTSLVREAAAILRSHLISAKTEVYDATGPDVRWWLFDPEGFSRWLAQRPGPGLDRVLRALGHRPRSHDDLVYIARACSVHVPEHPVWLQRDLEAYKSQMERF